MDRHPLEDVIAAYNEAWNNHDVEAIVSMHTEDTVFHNHTSGGLARGKAAVRAIVDAVFATWPDLHFETRRMYVRDDLVVQEWTATATFDHPIVRDGVELAPTGATIQWDGMDILPMRDGKVARKDVYADSLSYLRQLGVTAL